MTGVRFKVFSWDYKDQPNWEEITKFVQWLYPSLAHFHPVDTDSDSWAVMIADKKLLPVEVELLFED